MAGWAVIETVIVELLVGALGLLLITLYFSLSLGQIDVQQFESVIAATGLVLFASGVMLLLVSVGVI